MTDRGDVTGWARDLRALADRIEAAEYDEELAEIADEAEQVATALRSA